MTLIDWDRNSDYYGDGCVRTMGETGEKMPTYSNAYSTVLTTTLEHIKPQIEASITSDKATLFQALQDQQNAQQNAKAQEYKSALGKFQQAFEKAQAGTPPANVLDSSSTTGGLSGQYGWYEAPVYTTQVTPANIGQWGQITNIPAYQIYPMQPTPQVTMTGFMWPNPVPPVAPKKERKKRVKKIKFHKPEKVTRQMHLKKNGTTEN